jgi:hypothetical protein
MAISQPPAELAGGRGGVHHDPWEEPRHRLTAVQYRHEMNTRFTTWNEVVGLPATADPGAATTIPRV